MSASSSPTGEPLLRAVALLLGASTLVWGVACSRVAAEAARGDADTASAAYLANCASCHGTKLTGAFGPPLKSGDFARKWSKAGPAELSVYIATSMPPGNPGLLSADISRKVAEYILSVNGVALEMGGSGASPAPAASVAAESTQSGDREVSGLVGAEENRDAIYQRVVAAHAATLKAMRSVDEAALRHPPAADWLNWRRTDDGMGYSPLDAINRKTVGSLGLAWSLALPAGTNGITPLVHDGVLFINSSGTVLAIDAQSGDTLWKFTRPATVSPMGPPITQPRNLAIFGDKLYVPTIDNHMIALNARTGAVVWDHLISDTKGVLRLSGGPIVVRGKVIQGIAGCVGTGYPGGCFIVALDSETGAEKWRFNTIVRPGDLGGDSWNGAPLDKRFGGSVWSSGTYDPETNLVYFGVGQTYHITTLMTKPPKKGSSNAALYTDSTLALDPDSGRLVWYYQHLQRDVWDFDFSFERTIIRLPGGPRPRVAVATMGKLGILDVLDAANGKYVFSVDLGLQNVVTAINPVTGRKTTDPAADPEVGKSKFICPYATGVRNWPATSYDPSTRKFYIPAVDSCEEYSWYPGEDFDISFVPRARPGSDGKAGLVASIDVDSRSAGWRTKFRAPVVSSTLATAGGLVFAGMRDRRFVALDSTSGAPLWNARLDNVLSGSPVTYAVDSKQFVAVTTGGGAPNDVSRAYLTPELEPASHGTTLWVFRVNEPGAPPVVETP